MPSRSTIADFSALVQLATSSAAGRREHIPFAKRAYLNGVIGTFSALSLTTRGSTWTMDGQPGGASSAPSTPAVCTNATPGSLGQTTPTLGYRKIITRLAFFSRIGMWLTLYDRLSHQGGLSGSVTSTQTTNLPTAALTRRTDGLGVEPWLEIYTALGSAATPTLTASYTNDVGVAGQTTAAFPMGGNVGIGSAGFFQRPQSGILALAGGDRGCRAVASVTLSATTNLAGNFGVVLAYPLLVLSSVGTSGSLTASPPMNLLTTGGPLDLGVNSDACLAFTYAPTVVSTFEMMGNLWLLEAP